MNLTLTLLDDGADAQTIELPPGSYTVGSDEDRCDVTISDPCVSPQHCRLEFEDDRWAVSDLDSASGTIINSEMIPPGVRWQLGAQDQIQIGDTMIETKAGEVILALEHPFERGSTEHVSVPGIETAQVGRKKGRRNVAVIASVIAVTVGTVVGGIIAAHSAHQRRIESEKDRIAQQTMREKAAEAKRTRQREFSLFKDRQELKDRFGSPVTGRYCKNRKGNIEENAAWLPDHTIIKYEKGEIRILIFEFDTKVYRMLIRTRGDSRTPINLVDPEHFKHLLTRLGFSLSKADMVFGRFETAKGKRYTLDDVDPNSPLVDAILTGSIFSELVQATGDAEQQHTGRPRWV
jgi:hypothetical protein